VLVLGPVGCGKSSLLQALLGEMRLQAGAALFCDANGAPLRHRPRIAYSQQQPWLVSGEHSGGCLPAPGAVR
jgi:ABC-type Mn2+/Zn2+ transport system ATPase subunit